MDVGKKVWIQNLLLEEVVLNPLVHNSLLFEKKGKLMILTTFMINDIHIYILKKYLLVGHFSCNIVKPSVTFNLLFLI